MFTVNVKFVERFKRLSVECKVAEQSLFKLNNFALELKSFGKTTKPVDQSRTNDRNDHTIKKTKKHTIYGHIYSTRSQAK